MEFVLQVQIQSIVNRFPNDFRRSEERALTALKRRFNSRRALTALKLQCPADCSSKNSSFWSDLLELWTENAKIFGIFNNLLGFLGGRSPKKMQHHHTWNKSSSVDDPERWSKGQSQR
ncbi:hypothetical protein SUGI_0842810 [Cryptomeria japonica]|nr:hypothetical protein SUGI_0842810 [Cryptomeria japonica]